MHHTLRLLLLLPLLAFAPSARAIEDLPNKKCPLMTEDDVEAEHKLTYQGKDVYLCCSTCEKQWNKEPDYYAALARELKLLPQLADIKVPEGLKLLDQRFCPFTTTRLVGPASPSAEYKGVKIYFSKPGHLRTWNENPDKHAADAVAKGLLPQLKGKI